MRRITKIMYDGLRSSVQQPKVEEIAVVETLQAEAFQIAKTVRHGFPYQPTAIAFDPIQRILAVGTKQGSLRIIGRPGVDVHVKHEGDPAIVCLAFLINGGALVSATGDDALHLWNFQQKTPQILHSLKFQRERITTLHVPFQSKWLYLGTERGNIHIVNIETFSLSGYTINWNKAIELSRKTHPGAVVHLSDCPVDPGKLLIGYESGQLVLWDFKGRCAEVRYQTAEPLRSVSWHHEGKQFMCCHTDGSLTTWTLKQNSNRPTSTVFPHAKTNKEGKQESCKPIQKVEWKCSKTGESFVVFSGGLASERTGRTPSITVVQGKTTTVLEMEHNVIDFVTLCENPYASELSDPYALVVLLQNDLVVVDLLTPGYPCFENPYSMDIHESPVTCCTYLADCPADLTPALYSAGARGGSHRKQGFSDKEWPICGGNWGAVSCPYPEMILTGHADGSIKFWDASSVGLQILYKLKTAKVFEKPRTRSIDGEEDPFAIQHLSLCPESRLLCVAGATAHVLLFRFSKQETTAEIPCLEIPILYEVYESGDGSPEYDFPPRPSLQASVDYFVPIHVRSGPQRRPAGYQVELACLTPWVDGEPPGGITTLAINSSYGLLAYGNESGLVIIDYLARTCLLTMGTPDLYGSADPYQRAPRSPKRAGGGGGGGGGGEEDRCKSPASDQEGRDIGASTFYLRREEEEEEEVEEAEEAKEEEEEEEEEEEKKKKKKKIFDGKKIKRFFSFKIERKEDEDEEEEDDDGEDEEEEEEDPKTPECKQTAFTVEKSNSTSECTDPANQNQGNPTEPANHNTGLPHTTSRTQTGHSQGTSTKQPSPTNQNAGISPQHTTSANQNPGSSPTTSSTQMDPSLGASRKQNQGISASQNAGISPQGTEAANENTDHSQPARTNQNAGFNPSETPELTNDGSEPLKELANQSVDPQKPANHRPAKTKGGVQATNSSPEHAKSLANQSPESQKLANQETGKPNSDKNGFNEGLEPTKWTPTGLDATKTTNKVSDATELPEAGLEALEFTEEEPVCTKKAEKGPISMKISKKWSDFTNTGKKKGSDSLKITESSEKVLPSVRSSEKGSECTRTSEEKGSDTTEATDKRSDVSNSNYKELDPTKPTERESNATRSPEMDSDATEVTDKGLDATRSTNESGETQKSTFDDADPTEIANSTERPNLTLFDLSGKPVRPPRKKKVKVGSASSSCDPTPNTPTTRPPLRPETPSWSPGHAYMGIRSWLVQKKDKLDGSFSRSRSSSISSLENISSEAIQCLAFADTYTKKNDSNILPTLWVGTSLGSVIQVTVLLPPSDIRSSTPASVHPSGTIFRVKGSVLTMSFLDCSGSLIPHQYESWRDAQKEKRLERTPTKGAVTASPDCRMSPTNSGGLSHSSSGEGGSAGVQGGGGPQTPPPQSCYDRQFVVIASEKVARVVSLPTQHCVFKQTITEVSFVVKAEVVTIKDSVSLVCYIASGHISVFSLPSLRQLIYIDFLPLVDLRIARTFCFTHHGHGLYLCSPSEVQKFTISADFCKELQELLGDLFLPREMPEAPKQSFFRGLFGGGVSTMDRDELFGEASGKASRSVAKHVGPGSTDTAAVSARAGAATAGISRTKMLAIERGEKLGELEDRTARMMSESESLSSHAHHLMMKYRDKKWYQL